MRRDYLKVKEKANLLTAVGALLTIVPVGMCIMSIVLSFGSSPLDSLMGLGWAFFITIALLPLGLALFIGGLGWGIVLKRAKDRAEFEGDYGEEET